MSTELYDYYLEHGGPPLPEGYSFQIHRTRYHSDAWNFSIVGPPRGWFKRRKPEVIDPDCHHSEDGTYHAWRVSEETYREGDPINWFASRLYETYGEWRAVSYEAEMQKRWDRFTGTHP